jgi:transcriptional regulator with XRE-family HTH domain
MPERKRRSERRTADLDETFASLGRTLKVLRAERGMDRAELAELSGLSYPYLSEIENGKKQPSTSALSSLAEAFGMKLVDLLALAERRRGPSLGAFESTHASGPAAMDRGSWFRESLADASMSMPISTGPDRKSEMGAELIALLPRLAPEDVERLLDLARRLGH